MATGRAAFADSRLRRRAALGVGLSLLAIAAWYAPHIGEVRGASRIEDGVQIGTLELLVAPFHHVLIPALLWIDGTVLVASIVWLPLVLLAAVVIASSPLLRDRRAGGDPLLGGRRDARCAVACAGVRDPPLSELPARPPVRSPGERYGRDPRSPRHASAIGRTLACAALVGIVAFTFLSVVLDVVRYPREAPRIQPDHRARDPHDDAVLVYVRNPEGLDFYLDRPFRPLDSTTVDLPVCESEELVAFVTQPFGIPDVEISCLDRAGTRHVRARQYARGDEMNVWLVPPG